MLILQLTGFLKDRPEFESHSLRQTSLPLRASFVQAAASAQRTRESHLDRFVAIKVLPRESLAAPELKRRFTQEAKAASALNHPAIVTIHDITQADGTDFIAMEYVQGKTLGELIGRNGVGLKETLTYPIQAAGALAKAHAVGIVHHDLKPSNSLGGKLAYNASRPGS